jgi:methylglutaconyl-CoA hydratase
MLTIANDEGLFKLTFSSRKANALLNETLIELNKFFIDSSDDNTISAILLSSDGNGVFSAGADIDIYRNGSEADIADYLNTLGKTLISTLYFPKPVIVRVQGAAIGGALGLIASVDYSVASNSSKFLLPELHLGLAPSVISPFLLNRIGSGFLKSIAFSGEYFSSDWGLSSGLISEVVDDSKLDERVNDISQKISLRNIEPVKSFKKSLIPEKEYFIKKVEEYSMLNAKNIISAKKRGVFNKKS